MNCFHFEFKTLAFGLREGSHLLASTVEGLNIFVAHLCVSAYYFGLNLGSAGQRSAHSRIVSSRRLLESISRIYLPPSADPLSMGDDVCQQTGQQSRR